MAGDQQQRPRRVDWIIKDIQIVNNNPDNRCPTCGGTYEMSDSDPHWVNFLAGREPICPKE